VASVPLNIAEGSGCSTTEFSHYLGYAYRSLKGVITGLELSKRLYGADPLPGVDGLIDEADQIARMAHGLMQQLPSGPQRKPARAGASHRPGARGEGQSPNGRDPRGRRASEN
jgi:hypothetical protein